MTLSAYLNRHIYVKQNTQASKTVYDCQSSLWPYDMATLYCALTINHVGFCNNDSVSYIYNTKLLQCLNPIR